MGRKKIKIEKIHQAKNRQVTFNKRKLGLMKKAMELSVLCECDIALLIFSGDKLFQYSSSDVVELIQRFSAHEGTYECLTNTDFEAFKQGGALPTANKLVKSKNEDLMNTVRLPSSASQPETSLLAKRKFSLSELKIPENANQEVLQVVDEAEGLLLLRSPVVRTPTISVPSPKRAKLMHPSMMQPLMPMNPFAAYANGMMPQPGTMSAFGWPGDPPMNLGMNPAALAAMNKSGMNPAFGGPDQFQLQAMQTYNQMNQMQVNQLHQMSQLNGLVPPNFMHLSQYLIAAQNLQEIDSMNGLDASEPVTAQTIKNIRESLPTNIVPNTHTTPDAPNEKLTAAADQKEEGKNKEYPGAASASSSTSSNGGQQRQTIPMHNVVLKQEEAESIDEPTPDSSGQSTAPPDLDPTRRAPVIRGDHGVAIKPQPLDDEVT